MSNRFQKKVIFVAVFFVSCPIKTFDVRSYGEAQDQV